MARLPSSPPPQRIAAPLRILARLTARGVWLLRSWLILQESPFRVPSRVASPSDPRVGRGRAQVRWEGALGGSPFTRET